MKYDMIQTKSESKIQSMKSEIERLNNQISQREKVSSENGKYAEIRSELD